MPIAEPDDDDDDDDDGTEALVGRAVAEGACGAGLLVGTCLAWFMSGLVMVVLVVAAAVAGGRTTDAIRMGEARGTGSATVSTFDTTGAETTLMAVAAGTAGSAAVDTVGAAVLGSVGTAVGRLATSGAREGMIRPDGSDEEWLVDDVIVGGAGAAGMLGPGGLRVAVMARTRPPTRGESGALHARAGGRAGAAKEGGR